MYPALKEKIQALESMQRYPEKLFYSGNLELLKRPKVSIVGSRKPTSYSRNFTFALAKALGNAEICVVSGAALGIDAVAHQGAGTDNTIAVLPNGLAHKYPALNKQLITSIETNGLLLSQFDDDFFAMPWSFVARNETIVALGDVLIVTHADKDSGSMRSVEYAQSMGKKIYVLPQRLGESEGTNSLLKEGIAEPIYDIGEFVASFAGEARLKEKDPFLQFCANNPTLDEALSEYGEKVYEAELEGLIQIENGKVFIEI